MSEVVVVKRKVRIEEATADFGFVGAERFWEASNTVAADASVLEAGNGGFLVVPWEFRHTKITVSGAGVLTFRMEHLDSPWILHWPPKTSKHPVLGFLFPCPLMQHIAIQAKLPLQCFNGGATSTVRSSRRCIFSSPGWWELIPSTGSLTRNSNGMLAKACVSKDGIGGATAGLVQGSTNGSPFMASAWFCFDGCLSVSSSRQNMSTEIADDENAHSTQLSETGEPYPASSVQTKRALRDGGVTRESDMIPRTANGRQKHACFPSSQ